MIERHASITASVVRVLVGDKPNGTGFVVSEDGLIVTTFHVVQLAVAAGEGKVSIQFATDISVEFKDGRTLPAVAVDRGDRARTLESISKDFAILRVNATALDHSVQLLRAKALGSGDAASRPGAGRASDKRPGLARL